jgi:hypothetical protein
MLLPKKNNYANLNKIIGLLKFEKGGRVMKSRTKIPKKFSWKITAKPKKQTPDTIVFQEQCSCGPGGGGQCNGQCDGK